MIVPEAVSGARSDAGSGWAGPVYPQPQASAPKEMQI